MIELLLQAEGALSVGLLDRAEALYRQVANADPRNAIAIVGLSRVALERGQQQDALELARRALAIDPENVAAQRMVQRLEEVLAFRGEAVRGAGAPERGSDPATPPVPGTPVPPSVSETPPPSSVVEGPPPRRSLLDRLRGRRQA
jgi:tetratricopeptide (TPR) repeat protein